MFVLTFLAQIAGARRSAGLGQPQAVDSDPTLHVFDLRGLSAAMGNLAIGGGYETESSYAKMYSSFFCVKPLSCLFQRALFSRCGKHSCCTREFGQIARCIARGSGRVGGG